MVLAYGIPPDFGGGVLAKGCSWLYAVAASSGLIIYFQVLPGEANLTLDVKIMAREKLESEEYSYCGFCGRKLGLAYQMLPISFPRRPSNGTLLPPRFYFQFS